MKIVAVKTVKPLLACLVLLLAASGAQAGSLTTWDGVYNAEQAARGEGLYARLCAECHGAGMQGAMLGPALTGIGFLYVWDGRTLGELGELTRATMPPNASGSLRGDEIAALLAAVLAANAFPAGEESLPANSGALDGIVIRREQPSH